MPIIQVNHVTKEYRLGQLTRLKHTALEDIATGAALVSNSFVGEALAAKTENCCLTLLIAFIDRKNEGINTSLNEMKHRYWIYECK